jgi:GTP-binding protein Era
LKNEEDFRSGYVSIIGQPNVGKSTLLNSILGEKVAIVTPKPQTTRNKILGIKTIPDAQIIFIDTPGIHRPQNKLGETMVKTAVGALHEVDVILFMVEPKTRSRNRNSCRLSIVSASSIPLRRSSLSLPSNRTG